jgi:hypothetical protein
MKHLLGSHSKNLMIGVRMLRKNRAGEPPVTILAPCAKREVVQCVLVGICFLKGIKEPSPSPHCHSLNRSFLLLRLLRQDLLYARRCGAAVSQPCRQHH